MAFLSVLSDTKMCFSAKKMAYHITCQSPPPTPPPHPYSNVFLCYYAAGGCGSFFEVLVVSDKFNGKRMVQQHQMVNKILSEEIERMHGITVSTLTHQEYQKQLADQEL